jgi:hypothetical protein
MTTGICIILDFNIMTVSLIYFIGLVISRPGSLVIEEMLVNSIRIKKIKTRKLSKVIKFKNLNPYFYEKKAFQT